MVKAPTAIEIKANTTQIVNPKIYNCKDKIAKSYFVEIYIDYFYKKINQNYFK